jgi:proline utilization trans-activator
LVARSNPNSAKSPSTSGILFSSQIDREALRALRNWPTEQDAHSILEAVVLNVGISQQLFDVRTFSDNLSLLYQDSDTQVPRIWVCEVLLVFAIGRLLQARMDDASELPDTAFFREAMKYLPALSDLRRQNVLGIEVMGLAALYLQIVDRKDDAYIYSNTAQRLAIGHGMHRANTDRNLRRSEVVHRNRLWWSIYMQERFVGSTSVSLVLM